MSKSIHEKRNNPHKMITTCCCLATCSLNLLACFLIASIFVFTVKTVTFFEVEKGNDQKKTGVCFELVEREK